MPKSSTEKIDKLVKYDAVFRAGALRLVSQSRSASAAAARAFRSRVKLIYDWQKAAQTPAATAAGAQLDPATAAELRQLRADNRRQAQELTILKKVVLL